MEHIALLRICILIGGGLQFFVFILLVYQARKTKQWNTTTGKILASELSDFGLDTNNTGKTYKARIKYQYIVTGKKYVSRKIYYGGWIAISFSSYMRTLVAQYNVGEECTVYYNPRNPKKSVLKTGTVLPVYFLLLGAIVCVGVGICMYCI
jgi:hypothetical protein